MACMTFSSPALTIDQKRSLAKGITEVVVRGLNLTPEERQKCSLAFQPYQRDDVALGGSLMSDSAHGNHYHLDLKGLNLTEGKKILLVKELTNVIAKDLKLDDQNVKNIGICIHAMDHGAMARGGQVMAAVAKH